jgi:hypothetical protein
MNLMMIESAQPTQPPSPMTSPNELKRPRELEFALEFCGNPEETIARQYIEALEARAALAQPEPEVPERLPPRVGHILRLAEIIREVDGNHDKGAAALAEAILSHPGSRWSPAIHPVAVAERPWEREG